MKNIFKTLSIILTTTVLFYSCSEDDVTGASMINYTSPTVTLTTASTNVVVDESAIDPDTGHVIAVSASIPEPVMANLYIYLEQTGGTAGSGDYSINGPIEIKAGTTTGSTSVTIYQDCESGVEGDETLTIANVSPTTNANVTPFSMDISIENDYVNDVIEFEFDWSGEYTYTSDVPSEVTIDFCESDLDFVLADANGNALGYIAGTASCPEAGGFGGLPDGDYIILAEVYSSPFSAEGLNVPMPISVSYDQCGFSGGSFVNEVLNTDTLAGDVIPIATVTVSGGYNYTVTPWE
ncbi:hypothetical protein OS188_07915 [Xanthomarina sp. F1114]|uniref:hypothetical protein n=1 Tax=Xanthomarina sp. F1114 TaxID=2996019 RepID=UPI00225DEC35|nr:hypothetical protein [Xanthomarina sp. F1114]MCX7547876.1 hypothetical protein [Xanthomarina sp. F1114]